MEHFLNAFALLLNFKVFFFMLAGLLGGILAGALPGLTATMSVALLLPFTFWMEPLQGLLMLLSIYVGAMYGGAIPAILIRTPGTPAAAATCLDGFPLSQQGKAGLAVGISCITSVVGGVFSTLVLMFAAPAVASIALAFGPAEYFSLAVFGLSIIVGISGSSLIKGAVCGLLGMFFATVGLDPIVASSRFTFGSQELLNGISYIPLMIGVFGLAEAFEQTGMIEKGVERIKSIGRVLPTWRDLKQITPATLLACVSGTVVGAIPGAGGDIASFLAYDQAKRISKHPEEFGKGSLEGLAASETANNSVTGGALIPLLSLGVPGDSVTAVLLGALLVQGLRPGPQLFKEQPDLVAAVFVGVLVANLLVLPVGLLGASLFARVILIPAHLLWPSVSTLCLVGAYAVDNSFFDVWIALVFGVVGYFMKKLGFPSGPFILGVILGPMAEANLRRALMLSNGSLFIFFTHPISLVLLILAFVSVVVPLLRKRVHGKQG